MAKITTACPVSSKRGCRGRRGHSVNVALTNKLHLNKGLSEVQHGFQNILKMLATEKGSVTDRAGIDPGSLIPESHA